MPKNAGASNKPKNNLIEYSGEKFTLTGGLSADKLTLSINAESIAGFDGKITAGELAAVLRQDIPHELLDFAALAHAAHELNAGRKVASLAVARGIAPVKGRDSKLLLLVKHLDARDKKGEMIDLRYAKRFDNIKENTIVARIYPPAPGTDGKDVLGNPLLASCGAALKIKTDNLLSLESPRGTESFSRIVALSYGYLELNKDSLSLKKELSVAGDVDFHTGDIRFIGAVKVSGSVMKGFSVIAGDDIRITGDVLGGTLQSMRGSITVGGNIIGGYTAELVPGEDLAHVPVARLTRLQRHRDQITAANHVRAEIIDGASVSAGGRIEAGKEVRDSRFRTHEALLLPRGSLISGKVHAVYGVEAESVGTEAGAHVQINLCRDVESSRSFDDLLYQLDAHAAAENLLRLYLGAYADEHAQIKQLASRERQRIDE
ncbi:MAG TPA: FapA family protein, partial [Oligoflexia bacterium]|nr:FapA family protein [Oligoflexia bacterium]